MTGKTHIAIGVASALTVTQPETVPECLCAIVGGAIGGAISDIDSPAKRKSLDYSEDPYRWQIYTFAGLALALLLGLDYVSGDGAVDYIISNSKVSIIAGLVAFIGLCIWGAHTYHRSFTHSILAAVCFTASVYFFCRPLTVPFAIGFSSHLIIDFFNQKPVRYLWPLKAKFGLKKYPSDGKLNDTLGGIGVTLSVFGGTYFMIISFAGSTLLKKLIAFFLHPVTLFGIEDIPFVVPYLIIINIVAFIVYVADYFLYAYGLGFYKGNSKEDMEKVDEMESFIHTLLIGFDIAGGMIGKLLAIFILTRGKIRKMEKVANFNLYIIPLCILIIWLVMLFTFFIPIRTDLVEPVSLMNIGTVPVKYIVIAYFLIMNIIAMIVFPRMQRFAVVISKREKQCMLLSFFGGATGGYLSIQVTGHHQNASMLSSTLPEMMVMHAVVLSCMLCIA